MKTATIESIVADGGEVVWESDACKQDTFMESIVADGGYRDWKCHTLKSITSLKCVIAYGRQDVVEQQSSVGV